MNTINFPTSNHDNCEKENCDLVISCPCGPVTNINIRQFIPSIKSKCSSGPAYKINFMGIPERGMKSRIENLIKVYVKLEEIQMARQPEITHISNSNSDNTDNNNNPCLPLSIGPWRYLKLPPNLMLTGSSSPLLNVAPLTINESTSSETTAETPIKQSKVKRATGNRFKQNLFSQMSNETNTLRLHALVVCASNPDKPIEPCSVCIERELKSRLKRKKTRVVGTSNASNPSDDLEPSIVVFHRDSLVPLSKLSYVNLKKLENGVRESSANDSNSFYIPFRLICYCRHHQEKIGFRLCIFLCNSQNELVASGISPPILITDDHKVTCSVEAPRRKFATKANSTVNKAKKGKVNRKAMISSPESTNISMSTSESDAESNSEQEDHKVQKKLANSSHLVFPSLMLNNCSFNNDQQIQRLLDQSSVLNDLRIDQEIFNNLNSDLNYRNNLIMQKLSLSRKRLGSPEQVNENHHNMDVSLNQDFNHAQDLHPLAKRTKNNCEGNGSIGSPSTSVKLTSLSSSPTSLTKLIPCSGKVNDDVIVMGSGFDSSCLVFFNTKQANDIICQSSSVISCKVPPEADAEEFEGPKGLLTVTVVRPSNPNEEVNDLICKCFMNDSYLMFSLSNGRSINYNNNTSPFHGNNFALNCAVMREEVILLRKAIMTLASSHKEYRNANLDPKALAKLILQDDYLKNQGVYEELDIEQHANTQQRFDLVEKPINETIDPSPVLYPIPAPLENNEDLSTSKTTFSQTQETPVSYFNNSPSPTELIFLDDPDLLGDRSSNFEHLGNSTYGMNSSNSNEASANSMAYSNLSYNSSSSISSSMSLSSSQTSTTLNPPPTMFSVFSNSASAENKNTSCYPSKPMTQGHSSNYCAHDPTPRLPNHNITSQFIHDSDPSNNFLLPMLLDSPAFYGKRNLPTPANIGLGIESEYSNGYDGYDNRSNGTNTAEVLSLDSEVSDNNSLNLQNLNFTRFDNSSISEYTHIL